MNRGKLIFVYGTLKRGGSNHAQLAGQVFRGNARTAPGFQLYDLDGYPGMVATPGPNREEVTGEVWEVDSSTLQALDRLEGLSEGLYRRERIPLLPPFADSDVEAYIYARLIEGRRLIGSTWEE